MVRGVGCRAGTPSPEHRRPEERSTPRPTGVGAALRDAITMTDGAVDQANFDTYLPLRMIDTPKVEVHIVASAEAPTGVGEPGAPPIAPAVANAVFKTTGKPILELPLRLDQVDHA
jgi:isoquinoline 1-oxidoreductase subunit beta